MIEIREDRYYYGLWFANVRKCEMFLNGGDILFSVERDINIENIWDGKFRFRQKVDDKIWDSDDKKSIITTKIRDKNEVQMEYHVNVLLAKMEQDLNTSFEFFEVKGDSNSYFQKIKTNPPNWMHIKTVPLNYKGHNEQY